MYRPVLVACLVVLVVSGSPEFIAAAAGQALPSTSPVQPAPPAVPLLPAEDAGSRQAPPVATFKATTELVALNVTVTDGQNRYVTGLSKEDFAVFENGVRQDLTFFAAGSVPLDIAILIDTSASMNEKLPFVREAAAEFARTLRAGDRGEVLSFGNDTRILQPFTGDVGELERAIRSTTPRGGTALYNAVYIALQQFEKPDGKGREVRRRAIVLLTDGDDTSSLIGFDDVLERAKRVGIAIYPISILKRLDDSRPAVASVWRQFSQADFTLRTLAQETGGRVFFPEELSDLDGVYQQVATELSTQYSIGYPPKDTQADGAFRRIVVRLANHPGARARTRSGYYAARPVRALLLPTQAP